MGRSGDGKRNIYRGGLNDRLTTNVFTNREIRNRTCLLGKLLWNSNYVHTTSLKLTPSALYQYIFPLFTFAF